MIRKFDKLWLGFILGILIPGIFMLVMFMQESGFVKLLFTSFLRIGLIFNLAIFLLTFNTGFDRLPKGILMATIFYGMIIVYMFLLG